MNTTKNKSWRELCEISRGPGFNTCQNIVLYMIAQKDLRVADKHFVYEFGSMKIKYPVHIKKISIKLGFMNIEGNLDYSGYEIEDTLNKKKIRIKGYSPIEITAKSFEIFD